MTRRGFAMQIPIPIETVANNGYRASSVAPLALSAEGPTRDEAVRNLESLYRQRLAGGAEVAAMDVGPTTAKNPWVEYAGMLKDDPDFQEVLDIIAENRRKMDADPDIP